MDPRRAGRVDAGGAWRALWMDQFHIGRERGKHAEF
jgi:hypothetical protein